MVLGNFYEIMEGIIGSPVNDAEHFLIFCSAVILGNYIIMFVFDMFMMVATMFQPRRK